MQTTDEGDTIFQRSALLKDSCERHVLVRDIVDRIPPDLKPNRTSGGPNAAMQIYPSGIYAALRIRGLRALVVIIQIRNWRSCSAELALRYRKSSSRSQ